MKKTRGRKSRETIPLTKWFLILWQKIAHSVHADPSLLHPTCQSFLVLVHVVSAPAEHWLLLPRFPRFLGGRALPCPLPPSWQHSLRSQATACSHVGHKDFGNLFQSKGALFNKNSAAEINLWKSEIGNLEMCRNTEKSEVLLHLWSALVFSLQM